MQGGIVGAAAVPKPSSTSSGSQSSATTTATGNVGTESNGGVQWIMFAITGVAAIVIGSLIV